MDRIAIVILNFNGLTYLRKFLGRVVNYSSQPGVSVWVADNGSSDGSAEWVEENFPGIKTIRFTDNHGFAGGYNLALQNICANYYLLLNSDVEVTEGWLDPLLKFMDENPDAASVQPKILSWHSREYFEYAGASGGFIDKFGFTFCRGRIFGKVEKDGGQYDDTSEVFWTSGACMLVRASAWKNCGAFDPDFFAHMEEIDLCWRFHNRGWKLFTLPESVVYHVGGGSLPYNSPFKTYLNFRNNLFLIYKNLPEENFRRTIFLRKLFDGVAVVFFLLSGKPANALAVLKAHKDYYRNIASLKIKRKRNLNETGNSAKIKTIMNKSLVFEVYIRGKRRFQMLKKYFQ